MNAIYELNNGGGLGYDRHQSLWVSRSIERSVKMTKVFESSMDSVYELEVPEGEGTVLLVSAFTNCNGTEEYKAVLDGVEKEFYSLKAFRKYVLKTIKQKHLVNVSGFWADFMRG